MLKNADEFIPERYIEDTRSISACNSMHTTKRTDITFGFGRRTCPGSYLVVFFFAFLLIADCVLG